MSDYHQLLGVSSNASDAQIRNAYRKLAKKYHPDISKEPGAEQKFIEITEAYEGLLGKASLHEDSSSYSSEYQFSKENLRRQRAQQFAQMRYDDFRKSNDAFKRSWYYLPLKILFYSIVYCGYAVAGLMFLSPVIAYTIDGFSGLAALILFLFSSLVARSFWDLHKGIKPYFKNYN